MPTRYRSALVTGGAGFIGSHIVDALIERGIEVHIIDDLSSGKRRNLNPKATFHKISIASRRCQPLIEEIKPDIIIHAAAQQDVRASVADPSRDAKVNVLGTLNVIAGGVSVKTKKFIFLSTGGAIYPKDAEPPYSETVCPKPISPYAISKQAGENYFHFQYETYGIPYTVLRLANVYGPRQDTSMEGGVVAIFVSRMLSEEQAVIYGDGKQTRDYVYVDDVVRAVSRAMDKPFVGICNIGTGKETSVNELFAHVREATGVKMKEKHAPAKPGEVPRSALDARLAKKKLGWQPKTDMAKGIEQTVAWFREYMM